MGIWALHSGIKVVLFFVIASVLLGFTQMSTVSATSTSNPSFFEILSNGDITFIGAGSTTKMTVVGPPSFIWDTEDDFSLSSNQLQQVFSSNFQFAFAPVELPDGSTITEFECHVRDTSSDFLVVCELLADPIGSTFPMLIAEVSSSGNSGEQTLSQTGLSHLVDRDANNYTIQLRDVFCGLSCAFYTAKITYTVPSSGMTIGGTFYPVDNVSLILAYSLVNSWWMAPIGIGIGLGIYLVKRRF